METEGSVWSHTLPFAAVFPLIPLLSLGLSPRNYFPQIPSLPPPLSCCSQMDFVGVDHSAILWINNFTSERNWSLYMSKSLLHRSQATEDGISFL